MFSRDINYSRYRKSAAFGIMKSESHGDFKMKNII